MIKSYQSGRWEGGERGKHSTCRRASAKVRDYVIPFEDVKVGQCGYSVNRKKWRGKMFPRQEGLRFAVCLGHSHHFRLYPEVHRRPQNGLKQRSDLMRFIF